MVWYGAFFWARATPARTEAPRVTAQRKIMIIYYKIPLPFFAFFLCPLFLVRFFLHGQHNNGRFELAVFYLFIQVA